MSSFHPATGSRPAVYGTHAPTPQAPAGTFAPGTKIQVGSHKVVIQKYFSEGGFAHVYLVKMPKPIDGTDIAVLKRVAVPDKENLANMRTEVETMKKLKGHRPIVTYYDSHASQLKGGGYEVFLLMEFCNGGGLIDFMNTRLQNRLTEPEILKIFSDVTEGVACMHYLKPPLLHRDLKVENVLITSSGTSKRFKLCDFGSTAPPRPAATNVAECRLIEDDVQKHTTLQYRSPEMIDVYRKLPIDEKSDIWALGVLLYKLCYYTTPFEEQGQLAILNASFKFPAYPPFSDRLKKLIANMLREKPKDRPNVYQVLKEACLMQGLEVPIRDIYAGRTESESRRNQQLPPSPTNSLASPPIIGAVFSPPPPKQNIIPDVVPMRRGRPTTNPQPHVTKPSPSPMRVTNSDPFAALDAKPNLSATSDEAASKYPSLDQFSLLHDQGSKFEFDAASSTAPKPKDLSQRVTEKLADDAFVSVSVPKSLPSQSQTKPSSAGVSRAQTIISSTPALREVTTSSSASIKQPVPSKPTMVSTGTMTSPQSTPPSDPQLRKYTPSPIWRVPQQSDHHRSTSLPRDQAGRTSGFLNPPSHANSIPRVSSQHALQAKHASSSRPSLEGSRPDFANGGINSAVARPQASESHPRPSSAYLESNMDYLREREAANSSSRTGLLHKTPPLQPTSVETDILDESGSDDEPENIESNIDFLRSMEDQNTKQDKSRRTSSESKHSKRSSLPSMSLSSTKTLLAGKFGDAFKRFEGNTNAGSIPRTPSPLQDLGRRELTPIAGSEATDGYSDDGLFNDDREDLSPEQRREVERRRLSMEERRVATAAAEYRRRLAERDNRGPAAPKSIGGVTRAASIQNKVKNLLDENQKPSPTKTAEGYGRFTDGGNTQARNFEDKPLPTINTKPTVARKPLVPPTSSSSVPPLPVRPTAPPKPVHLNSAATGGSSPPKQSNLPSNTGRPIVGSGRVEARPDMTPAEREDYVSDFSKRYPSLDGIKMVESDVPRRSGEVTRGKPNAIV